MSKEIEILIKRAKKSYEVVSNFPQYKVDDIVKKMAEESEKYAEYLAKIAVGETGMGRLESKIEKNLFASREVYKFIKDLKTTGIINVNKEKNIYEIAQPIGIIGAVIPVTNPTSTTIFKALISIKSRNCVIFAPHPRAVRCTEETVKILRNALKSCNVPEDSIQCITNVSLEKTQFLMKNVDFILATGGPGLVKAAYESGKPAIGVGPGNTPAYIDKSADIDNAVKSIIASQLFDFGTICSSEQSVVVHKDVEREVIKRFKQEKAYFLSPYEVNKLSEVAIKNNSMNPQIVGQPAYRIAQISNINVPKDTTVLLAPLDGVGPNFPLSREKLSPILAFYVEDSWEKACEKCIELISFGGSGHTLGIHATDPDVILKFSLKANVSRVVINSSTSQGAIGLATSLVPSLTLGCGSKGGNITSDNISALHLINIKRVAIVKNEFIRNGNFINSNIDLSNSKYFDYNLKGNSVKRRINPFEIRNYPSPSFFLNKSKY